MFISTQTKLTSAPVIIGLRVKKLEIFGCLAGNELIKHNFAINFTLYC